MASPIRLVCGSGLLYVKGAANRSQHAFQKTTTRANSRTEDSRGEGSDVRDPQRYQSGARRDRCLQLGRSRDGPEGGRRHDVPCPVQDGQALLGAWAVSCLGYKTIARSADCNKGWVPVALRAAVNGGIIGNLDGVSKYNTNKYAMSVGFIEEFVERARLPVPEILKEFRRLNPDLKKLAAEDEAEEQQMMEAEDAGIPVFAVEGKSVPTAEEIMDEAGLCLTSSGDREFGCQTST